jgi:hypothetical protein
MANVEVGSVMLDLDPEDILSSGPAGAVPPTGGVAPRAGDLVPEDHSELVTDQLADSLELMLRALRALQGGSVDAELERAAQQSFFALQRLGTEAPGPSHERAQAERDAAAQQLSELVREMIGALERL